MKCLALAVGGDVDHVHVLVRFPAALAVAKLVGEVKGVSSHLMTHRLRPEVFFKWQGAYGAFTVPKDGLKAVEEYIRNQKVHHAANHLVAEWERCEGEDE